MIGQDKAVLKKVSVSLPFGLGSAEWESDPTERFAAWELYVELVTRIAVQPFDLQYGGLREALNSLYRVFPSTREILRAAGPNIGASPDSVGGIAIAVLNIGVRPFLAKWHNRLSDWEAVKPADKSAREHERDWQYGDTMKQELIALQADLSKYADALAKIAEVRTS